MLIHVADNYCHGLTLTDTSYPAVSPKASKNRLFSSIVSQSTLPEISTKTDEDMEKSYFKSSIYCLPAERVDLVPGHYPDFFR
jgi:hypothetical protein